LNLHEVDEFLSSCCSWKLLGILDELKLIIGMLAVKEGLLDIVLSWESIRSWHHGSIPDKDFESNKEFSCRHGSVSATGMDVLNEGGSIYNGTDSGCNHCLDRIVLSLVEWTRCWQTKNRLLVLSLMTVSENRLEVDNLVMERHTQGVGLGFKVV
jgi:hypothetical protein